MDIVAIDKKHEYIKEIEKIYFYSFPVDERIDFVDIINKKFPNSELYAFCENEELIGFSYVSVLGDFSYIIYLAIDETKRSKGYGKIALAKINELYKDKTKVLCVEKPTTNIDIKSRRINFYKRNNFMLANFEFEYLGQCYYSMYNGKFNRKKFIEFLLICFPGCKNFKEIIK